MTYGPRHPAGALATHVHSSGLGSGLGGGLGGGSASPASEPAARGPASSAASGGATAAGDEGDDGDEATGDVALIVEVVADGASASGVVARSVGS
jgi:hypothetical protein